MDDLVKRLRDTPNWMREGFQDWKDNVRTYDRAPFEAADRIEELEELYSGAKREDEKAWAYAAELEAKLANAMEAFIAAMRIVAEFSNDAHLVKWSLGVIAEMEGRVDE